jgi:hypothetical protein
MFETLNIINALGESGVRILFVRQPELSNRSGRRLSPWASVLATAARLDLMPSRGSAGAPYPHMDAR